MRDEDALRVNLVPLALSLDACTVARTRANACWRVIIGIDGYVCGCAGMRTLTHASGVPRAKALVPTQH